MSELCISDILAAVAAAVPNRDCIVHGSRKTSYKEFDQRSNQLANHIHAFGLGCHTERADLSSWESGQDHIGLYMYNCTEYMEAEFAAVKSRTVAVNINFRYIEQELVYLCRDAGLKGLIFHSAFADRIRVILPELPELKLLIQVPDESGNDLLPGAVWYDDALAAGAETPLALPCSPDDLHMLYTGGTTGYPKGVLWRQADLLVAGFGGRNREGLENQLEDYVHSAERSASRTLPSSPFMHATGRWTAMSQILLGNPVVLPDNTRHLDADNIWSTIEREGVASLSVTGDAIARPLLEQLAQKEYDLSSLRVITNGAAVLSVSAKQGLLNRLPDIRIIDTIGASETGPQASSESSSKAPVKTPLFNVISSSTVLDKTLQSILPKESEETGWLARSGRAPLGYLGDESKTQRGFPTVDGIRYAVPGDRACWRDGAVHLLGRDAMVINTGGEKVYAEEVEVAIKHHPEVFDAIVCGRDSERWGNEIVAFVKVENNSPDDELRLSEEIRGECGKHLARYKLPKAIFFRAEIPRSASGKPDYAWAKQEAAATINNVG